MSGQVMNPTAVKSYPRMLIRSHSDGDTLIPEIYPAFASDNAVGAPQTLLHLTARIGLPLFFYCFRDHISFRPTPPANLVSTDISENPIIHHLSPKKTLRPGIYSRRTQGEGAAPPNIMLTRADGKDLTADHVYGLWCFVEHSLGKIKREMPDISEVHQNELFFSQMTPENFVQFWPKYNLREEECPVKLGCRTCGKTEGITLSRCGKCGVAKYCDQECQKGDWGLHKKVCKLYCRD
ncbi:uncharacterized protein RCC_06081 [Ramularia collo-cygni]|uniref:MYND-type domain-containing protein n=1 Tax=Ramularia collo-cygni TaxID=112498 RepID=A0A2D3VBX2_9PEZI|nr:uncharacterized protein RCC_06081 [Ramularia collo-cygni]CZT20224.1 uncharacterized protein RCC_06081 [Ramularia collo-cygni]